MSANSVLMAERNKWETSHRQGVIFRTLPVGGAACDTSHMQKKDELERVRSAIRRAMARKDIKAKPLSKAAGLGETAVRDILESRSADPRLGTLRALAASLDTSVEELIGSEAIVVSGRIGAGGSVLYEETSDETVPRPAGLGGKLEALEVIGDSMLPRYSSGEIVYISRDHDGARDEYFGEFCAVRVTSGETYIKQLARGSRPGFFTLRSLNAADIEDVEIQWATPILSTLSRAARKRMGF